MTAFDGIVLTEIVSTIFYSFFGLFLLLVCWWVIELVTPFSLRRELEEDQNTAIAVIMGAIFISLAIIIAAIILS